VARRDHLSGGIIGPLLLTLGLFPHAGGIGCAAAESGSLATMGLAWLVFRENVDQRLLLGAFSIVAGAIVLAWDGRGVDLDAGACLAWDVDNNLTRKRPAADPVVIAMLKGLIAGAVNTGFALWWGAALPAAGIIGAAALVGFVGIGVSLVLFVPRPAASRCRADGSVFFHLLLLSVRCWPSPSWANPWPRNSTHRRSNGGGRPARVKLHGKKREHGQNF
jgi:drug/metabolite transporter (DMT)-like permease